MENTHSNLTDAHREKGRAIAITNRNEKAKLRRAGVKRMLSEGKSKAEIARFYNVNWETINRDSKIIDAQTPRAEISEIITAVLVVTRKEVTGELTTLEAREEIQKLIETAADAEIRKRL